MAIITLLSAKGAPGCSTTALGLTLRWPTSAVLTEADLTGSAVMAGYLRGEFHQDRGVLQVAIAQATTGRVDMVTLWAQTLPLARPDAPEERTWRQHLWRIRRPALRPREMTADASSSALKHSHGESAPAAHLLPGIPQNSQARATRSVWGELAGTLRTLEDGEPDPVSRTVLVC